MEDLQRENVASAAVDYTATNTTATSSEIIEEKKNELLDQYEKNMMISNAVNNTVVKIGEVKRNLDK